MATNQKKQPFIAEAMNFSKSDKDPSYSTCSIREVFQNGIYQTKGIACAVTWRGVIESDCNKPVVMDRYCRNFPSHIEKHRLKMSSIDEKGSFSYLSVDGGKDEVMKDEKMKGCSILNLMAPRNQESDFVAYSFSGKEDFSLNFKYDKTKNKHELSEVPKLTLLEKTSVIGSPILVVKNSRTFVVGVVGVSVGGELCPYFITEQDLGEQGRSSQDKSKLENQEMGKLQRNGENHIEENKSTGYKGPAKAGMGYDICTRHTNSNMQIPRGDCYSCAKENSMRGHSFETELIDSYLKKCGKTREPVTGDGHCILHAFAQGLNEIDQEGHVSRADSLLPQIREEFKKNIEQYRGFINLAEIDPFEELEIYIKSKDYTLSMVDLMPQLLANMKKTTIVIYQVSEGTVSPLTIPPSIATAKEVKCTIYLSKIGQQYDAIRNRNKAGNLSSKIAYESSPAEGGNDSDSLQEDVQSSETDVTDTTEGSANAMGEKVPFAGTSTSYDTSVTSRQPEDGARSSNTNPGPIVTGTLNERDGPGATVYKSGAVSKEILPDLAFDVQKQRKELYKALELEDADWYSIEADNKNDGVYEQTIKMLFRWLECKGSKATYAVLGEALKEVDLIVFLDGYCRDGHSSPRPPLDIPGYLKVGLVSKVDRRKVAKAVKEKWKRLGRSLGTDEGTLDTIKSDHQDDISEQSYQMIVCWQQTKGSKATYEELAKALLHRTVGMREVVEQILL